MSAKTDHAERTANGVTAKVVPDGGDGSYAMLASSEFSADGAFLAGALFFEVGEKFTLQVSRPGVEPVEVRVGVVEIERGDAPGMWVEFIGLEDGERARLVELIDAK